ncbi:hypothetical protein [Streptomyces sp. C10-9-1]|uniref:hypothetical protein n=1 Tax=Streptomyces sp. C10-9-1 TaxID=1859285 RepID=UPI003F4A2992
MHEDAHGHRAGRDPVNAEVLTEAGQDTDEVLAELQHAAVAQAEAAYQTARTTAS